MLRKLILHLHFAKSMMRSSIDKLCLWTVEEDSWLILMPSAVSHIAHTRSSVTILKMADVRYH